jgi:hypothetical protein
MAAVAGPGLCENERQANEPEVQRVHHRGVDAQDTSTGQGQTQARKL